MKDCPACKGTGKARSGRNCPACKGQCQVSPERFKEILDIQKDLKKRSR